MKSGLIAAITATLLGLSAQGQNQPPAIQTAKPSVPPAAAPAPITKDKISYAVGMSMGNQWKQNEFDFDPDIVTAAIKDILAGTPTKMTEAEMQSTIQAWQAEMRPKMEAARAKMEAKREETRQAEAVKNKAEGDTFLAANAKKDGVKTTASGLQYRVITEGKGAIPKSTDTVSTHYVGRLLDGKEFDSSRKREQPAEFPVSGVIKGWTEALLLMKTGSKWELTIPSNLAYGEKGNPRIPPNSTLIFEIELLAIKPAPEESVHAVSGEIIKVPSEAELKKGAKIEVIKPDQTNSAPAPKK